MYLDKISTTTVRLLSLELLVNNFEKVGLNASALRLKKWAKPS